MVKRQRFPNQWDSPINLGGGMSAVQTTCTVDDASALSTEGDYQIICDNEIMTVTSRSGNVLTVIRAQEGTIATTHSDNRDVFAAITAGGVLQSLKDAGRMHDLAYTSVADRLQDRDESLLQASDFTARNSSGSTLSDQNGKLIFRCQDHTSVNHFTGWTISQPTPPWTLTAYLSCPRMKGGGSANKFGIGMRGTSGGRMSILVFTVDYNVFVRRQNTFLSWNSSPALEEYHNRQDCWLRISSSNSASNPLWRFQYSADGYTWVQFYSENENDFVNSGYQLGFWANNEDGVASNHFHVESFVLEPLDRNPDFTI